MRRRMHFEEKDDRHGGAAGGQAVVGNSTRVREADLIALGSRLSALGSRLSALGSRLSALGSRLSALGSRLSALGSRLSALGSRLSALGSRLSALGSRLSAHNSRVNTLVGCQAFFRAVHNFFSLRAVATGKPRAQGGRSDHSQRHPLPISEAPHETGVSGFVEVSKDTGRRDTVRNFNVSTSDPSPVPLQFKRTSTGS